MYDRDLRAHVCQYCDYAIRGERPVTFGDVLVPGIMPAAEFDAAWHYGCALIVDELERQRVSGGAS